MSLRISRRAYADMYGPTVGDKVRLADTELIIEVEEDRIDVTESSIHVFTSEYQRLDQPPFRVEFTLRFLGSDHICECALQLFLARSLADEPVHQPPLPD